MKNLLTVIFLVTIHLGVLAQQEVFRIDSIPTQGILLDKGWKFHAGDNPDFAKPDFDDTQWESIDPTKDVMDLKQFGKQNIGWFRLTFKVDSSLFGQTFALSVRQVGSSQIFNNGSLITQIGEFSTKTTESKGYDPSGASYRLTFGKTSTQIIAVKFEKDNISLFKHLGYDNICLSLKVIPVEQIISNFHRTSYTDYLGQSLSLIIVGFFLLIAFLHLWLYFDEKMYISNLIFGIGSLFIGAFFICIQFAYYFSY